MTTFRVERRLGLVVGGLIVLAIVLADAAFAYLIRSRPISLLTFTLHVLIAASLAAIALMVYWLWGLLHASYALDRNQLVIRWGFTRQTVPMAAIERAVDGADVQGRMRLHAFHWFGHYVGPGYVSDLGLTLFYATGRLWHQVLLVTPTVTYALTPADKQGFLEAFTVRHRMGGTQAVEQESVGPGWLRWPLWSDRGAWAVVAGALALNLVLFAFLSYAHAGLPGQIPLHFDAAGAIDRWGAPGEIFFLPFIGLAIWVINGLAGGLLYMRMRETGAAFLLWSAAALMQALLWVAALNLLGAVP